MSEQTQNKDVSMSFKDELLALCDDPNVTPFDITVELTKAAIDGKINAIDDPDSIVCYAMLRWIERALESCNKEDPNYIHLISFRDLLLKVVDPSKPPE